MSSRIFCVVDGKHVLDEKDSEKLAKLARKKSLELVFNEEYSPMEFKDLVRGGKVIFLGSSASRLFMEAVASARKVYVYSFATKKIVEM